MVVSSVKYTGVFEGITAMDSISAFDEALELCVDKAVCSSGCGRVVSNACSALARDEQTRNSMNAKYRIK